MRELKIGLFGFGVVGEGIFQVLSQKPQLGCVIQKVVIKQQNKKRNAPKELFTTNPRDVLNDPSINLVVELIDDADAALNIVSKALANGKSVVSANKKMIAENHLKLIQLSVANNVSFLYEAAACGSVPIIRNLEEYFDNDLLKYVRGIVNGSTNYILSKMNDQNLSYDQALIEAKNNGFAESDPSLDVEGIDAAFKTSIITLHAFGKQVCPYDILRKGITSLHQNDFQYAKEKGFIIKLLAKSILSENGSLTDIHVLPTFVRKGDSLRLTNNEYNGVQIGSSLADEQFLYGKGAGRYPTSSAVLSDISALKYGYQYEYKKGLKSTKLEYSLLSKFYIGYDHEVTFDTSIFDSIDEQYSGTERAYIIGMINHKKLQENAALHDNRISIVSFD